MKISSVSYDKECEKIKLAPTLEVFKDEICNGSSDMSAQAACLITGGLV